MRVKEVMTSPVEMVSPDAMITEAAEKMKCFNVGVLPVVKEDDVVGMITDRDIVLTVIAEKLDPQTTNVAQAMSCEAFYCYEDDDIEAAAIVMEHKQIRRLLVMGSDNTLRGILSIGDIACKTRDEHMTYELVEKVCEPVHAGT